jgi:hypothetical protein
MGREVYHYILVAWDFVIPALSVDDSVMRYSSRLDLLLVQTHAVPGADPLFPIVQRLVNTQTTSRGPSPPVRPRHPSRQLSRARHRP